LFFEINRAVQAPDISCFLLAHCRGKVLYFAVWDNSFRDISFTEEEFPAGVIQFVLFDELMNPLSERLVFNQNYSNDVANIELFTDKTTYQKREKVITTLSLYPSHSGRAGEGLLSVAITDDKDVAIDASTTILSSLLLSSELKGYIENPAYYLQDNPESAVALDYLMLTHGWRRYEIPDIVRGNPKQPKIPFQLNQEISEKVKNLVFSRTVPDSEILIMASDGEVGLTATDENGQFLYSDFEYPDSASFIIQALSKRGNDRIELVMDDESFPKPVYAPFVETVNNPSQRTNTFIEKAGQRAHYDEDMWMIQLDEVEVTAQRINRRDEKRLQFWANVGSDATIRREEIEKRTMQYTSDYLQLISGLTVYPDGRVFIRSTGPSGRAGGGLPLIVIDGIAYDWGADSVNVAPNRFQSPLERVPPSNIESIDVFKGARAVAFGVRGANGVISITTRRGENSPYRDKPNIKVYNPLGYQKPVEFYSPVYETLESKHLKSPDFRTTIFWKPDIVIANEEETFEFFTSDFPTTYSVVIEGITANGKIIQQVEKIQIE